VGLSFSIDEEIGGNGTLSLLGDVELTNKSIVVLEPTKLIPHPANRGALWFQISLHPQSVKAEGFKHSVALEIVRKLFANSLSVRQQYPHPLFEEADVQVCMGMLNGFGNFPASACTDFAFYFSKDNHTQHAANELHAEWTQFLTHHEWLKQYTGIAHQPEHLSVIEEENLFKVNVSAIGGHMGSKTRGADAIVKAALLTEFIESKFPETITFENKEVALTLEGGQGFLPSMKIAQLQELIIDACHQAFAEQKTKLGFSKTDLMLKVEFEKIHNDAYCSRENAPGYKFISKARGELLNTQNPLNPTGWQASCDARLFAKKSTDVVTFGAGSLELAHGPDEFVSTRDILNAAGILFLAIAKRHEDEQS
jgi:acetylornithine deacetylase/succinyl-diaminopimelate desuccinylase-like protein